MTHLSDQDVVHRLAGSNAPEALAELVRRYGGLVYSAALRQVRDGHLAEDVMQAVFIVLVRKARSIRPDAVLAAWFFTVTRHACQNALRMERRRRHHETKKAAMMQEQYVPAEVVEQVVEGGLPSLLFDAIAKLQESDRSAVVLRYFQNRSHREIAEALAVSEEAARKRLARALDKMRSFLEWHGVSDAQAALSSGLAQSISTEPVPSALISSIVNVALLSHATLPSASVLSIAKGVARMITFTPQVKAAMITAGVLGILGVAAVPMLKSAPASAPVSAAASGSTSQPAVNSISTAAVPDDLNDVVAVVSDQIKVHVLGVATYPGDANSWWSASGNPIVKPDEKNIPTMFSMTPPPTHQVLLRIEKPDTVFARSSVAATRGSMGFSSLSYSAGGSAAEINLLAFTAQPDAKTVTLNVRFAEADWQTIATDDKPSQEGDFDTKNYGTFHMQSVDEQDFHGNASNGLPAPAKRLPAVVFLHHRMADPTQTVVVDDAGEIHHTVGGSQSASNGQLKETLWFDLPLASVKKVLIQVQVFNKKLEVKDISLVPGQTTNPQVTVSDISPNGK